MKHAATRSLFPALLLVLATGCSVAPYQTRQAPVDDRSNPAETSAPAQTTQQESYPEPAADSAVVSPLPDDDISNAASPSPAADPTPTPVQTQQSPAVLALLDDAAQARASGDYRAAQGSLQRAQRIAPRDPAVYYSLAETHMEQEDYNLAEQVALKGVSVAQGNPYQSQRLWQLLAKIRLRAGDAAGSRAAADKAASF